uniref:Secreted protein n=1 Tax=Glossina austeni TaxID=7395 RepID=A0A1A9VRY4_GLOAU
MMRMVLGSGGFESFLMIFLVFCVPPICPGCPGAKKKASCRTGDDCNGVMRVLGGQAQQVPRRLQVHRRVRSSSSSTASFIVRQVTQPSSEQEQSAKRDMFRQNMTNDIHSVMVMIIMNISINAHLTLTR